MNKQVLPVVFAACSLGVLASRILILWALRLKYESIPDLLSFTTVTFVAICGFTALGFHRDFYDSIVARRIRGTVPLYSEYLSVLTVWILLCAAAVFAYTSLIFGDLFIGATFAQH